MRCKHPLAFAVVALLYVGNALGNTDGIYVLSGSGYSIEVKYGPGTITVVEPNKVSVYAQSGASNDYLFTNPTNNITYGLRILDDSTLQAFKPGSKDEPTTLRLQVLPSTQTSLEAEKAEAVAGKYFALSESDPQNSQTWSQCAAAAMARTVYSAGDANDIVLQSANLLKLVSVDTGSSPCPDAIAEEIWDRAKAR